MLKQRCINCDDIADRSFNINSNLSCQKCGNNSIVIESPVTNTLLLICLKCSESFAITTQTIFNCLHKCGSTTYEIRQGEDIDVKTKVSNFIVETKNSYKFVKW